MSLTPEQQQHVEMSQAWLGLFRRLCTKYNSKGWRLAEHSLLFFKAVKAGDIQNIIRLCAEREQQMFLIMNRKERKVVLVYCNIPNFNKDFSYLDFWDPYYDNYPSLTFIGLYKKESFVAFEKLFVQFIQAKTPEEIDAF